MKSVGIDYRARRLAVAEQCEPPPPKQGEVLLRIAEVGVCGTDRELAAFHFGEAPPASPFLVLGHEAVACVAAAGPGVRNLRPGDWVVPMVRRPCLPACPACARNRCDLCHTSLYLERGILRLGGYWTAWAVDPEAFLIPIPERLAPAAVLVEPLSVVQKALRAAFAIRRDIHGEESRSALVFGAGAVGLLAALALQARGLPVELCSLEPPDHPRASLARRAGIAYYPLDRLSSAGVAAIVVEATGSPEAAFAALQHLAPAGVCCLLGSSNAYGYMPFLQMILGNHTVFGSVNAAPQDFNAAVEDLSRFDASILRAMLRRLPFDDFQHSIVQPAPDAVKLVHVVDESIHW